MTWREISKAPLIAKKQQRWLRLKGDNDGPYQTIGYWHAYHQGWIEIGTQGQLLTGVTYWAPFS